MNIDDIKLFVADLDGTLILKGEMLMPYGIRALEEMHKRGIKIAIASGRPLDHKLIDRAKLWGLSFPFDYVIGMNGGDIYDLSKGEIEHFYLLQPKTIKRIVDFLWPLNVSIIAYLKGYDEIIVNKIDERIFVSQLRNQSNVRIVSKEEFYAQPTGKLEINYLFEDQEKFFNIINQNSSDEYSCVQTYEGTVEYIDSHVNKGFALNEICKRMSISNDNVISFGDMENDIPLFENSKYSVCLKNGSEQAKASAKYITEYDVYNDGLGKYICEHLLDIHE